MPCRLLVIMGAGASFDCASGIGGALHEDWRPPLVTQLFENRRNFTRVLHNYPLAEQAAADIRPAIADGSVAIEAFLRDRLRDSEFEHDRRQYWAIPLYLQHLLFEVSMWDYDSPRGYAEQPDSYDRLIYACLRTDEVTFVTLNYDDLFDRRLFMHAPLSDMNSYLGANQKWSLIKLHGSINWGRAVTNPGPALVRANDVVLAAAFGVYGDRIELDDTIHLRRDVDLYRARSDEILHGGTQRRLRLYYPALAAPLGTEDEIVCPPNHVEHLRQITGHYEPLDVLVIGYSGLDQEVLNLVSWGGRPIRSLCVVSDTAERAALTANKITERVRLAPPPGQEPVLLAPTGFAAFAYGGLDDYIARIRAIARDQDAARASLHNT